MRKYFFRRKCDLGITTYDVLSEISPIVEMTEGVEMTGRGEMAGEF